MESLLGVRFRRPECWAQQSSQRCLYRMSLHVVYVIEVLKGHESRDSITVYLEELMYGSAHILDIETLRSEQFATGFRLHMACWPASRPHSAPVSPLAL